MEHTTPLLPPTHFRYLTLEDQQSPVHFLTEFCLLETDIEFFRQDVLTLFQASCSSKSVYNSTFFVHADEFVYNHRQLIHVFEFLWHLYHQPDIPLALTEAHLLFQKNSWKRAYIDVENRLNGPAKHFRVLENQEMNDIRLFLEHLFSFKSLTAWRDLLDDVLSYAHID